ncbi:MAG: DUF6242 domain-containing protein [Firmicutes bacterium]|nr:DUF6242 domain-containing protein [Bacillota bacterium]MCM1401623.1 DUF6242 domain-containing protein [Bacteroides sp.]MCM1477797.1 DUF6242 domain-containing protein [Bacteroides sp.]
MKRYFPLYILMAVLAASVSFTACNDDKTSDSPLDTSDQFAVMITSFSLRADDSILANLDSVFFSIDLNNARVFNADSLPRGTRVDSLGVSIGFYSVSKAEITMPSSTGADTVVDYLENSSAPINFSRGYVTLHIESVNALAQRDYRIYVNVHEMEPDSLCWGNTQWTSFPTTLSAPTALKAVEYKDQVVCFASNGTSATRAVASNPALNGWQTSTVNLPAELDVNSMVCGNDLLFALGADGSLMQSVDGGESWTSLPAKFSHLYGVYQSAAVGVEKTSAGTYNFITYPATTTVAVPEDAPVSGTSQAVTFVSEWAENPMMMVLGGNTASGSRTEAVWAYDGSEWVSISNSSPVPPVSGAMLVPYFTYKVSLGWVATKHSALLAFGGLKDDGTINRNVYVSLDRGVNWFLGNELLQLPKAVPSLYRAQALVCEQTLESRATSHMGWHSVELPTLPSWYVLDAQTGISPIESWECPYIYLFGGFTDAGQANTEVWRGVINRLSFKPLQ